MAEPVAGPGGGPIARRGAPRGARWPEPLACPDKGSLISPAPPSLRGTVRTQTLDRTRSLQLVRNSQLGVKSSRVEPSWGT